MEYASRMSAAIKPPVTEAAIRAESDAAIAAIAGNDPSPRFLEALRRAVDPLLRGHIQVSDLALELATPTSARAGACCRGPAAVFEMGSRSVQGAMLPERYGVQTSAKHTRCAKRCDASSPPRSATGAVFRRIFGVDAAMLPNTHPC